MTPINQQGSLTIIGCPDEITVIAAPGVNQLPVGWEDPVAFDMQGNFAGKEGFPSPGSSFPIGTSQVFSTYFGNSQQLDCNFNVTVKPGNSCMQQKSSSGLAEQCRTLELLIMSLSPLVPTCLSPWARYLVLIALLTCVLFR